MTRKYKKEDCILLLREKYEELKREGLDRYPQRSDFSEAEVVAIKAFLGPWPRALESAGIKPKKDGDRREKNREKRIRAKRSRSEALRSAAENNNAKEQKNGEGEDPENEL